MEERLEVNGFWIVKERKLFRGRKEGKKEGKRGREKC